MRQVREEDLVNKNQHKEMSDLITNQLKMVNEEKMIRSNQVQALSKTGTFNKSMTKIAPENSTFSDLSPQSRYEKTVKMIGLMKRNRQFKNEQYEHNKKNYMQ